MAGARRFEDLVVWQLADELEQLVRQVTRSGRVRADLGFCDQVRRASASVSANIAEGFGRYEPREFARFLRIARGSLNETRVHLRRGLAEGYLRPDEFERLTRVAGRCGAATTKLIKYLQQASGSRQRAAQISSRASR